MRDSADGTRVSTHITWAGDEAVVVQQATQDARGRLLAYDEVHGQRGEAYHFDGDGDGDGDGVVVVGPTLFEFARRHLAELRAGRAVALTFWDRGACYAFALMMTGERTIEMRATDAFVGFIVAPMQLELDDDDDVVAYRGRIPPLFEGRSVDADVTYAYFAPFR